MFIGDASIGATFSSCIMVDILFIRLQLLLVCLLFKRAPCWLLRALSWIFDVG